MIFPKASRQESRMFLRFCVVGILNTAINYAVFLLLFSYVDVYYIVAGPVGFLCGAISGFFLNRAWTFQSDISTAAGLARYLAAQVVSLGAHLAAQWLSQAVFGVPEVWTQLAGIAVSTLVNFLLLRMFVFGNTRR